MKIQKRKFGLIIMTKINDEVCAVLQRTGEFNLETMEHEFFSGAKRLTCYWESENENFETTALLIAVEKELGIETKKFFLNNELISDIHFINAGREIKICTVFIENPNFLKKIRLKSSSGGIYLVPKRRLSNIMTLFDFTEDEIRKLKKKHKEDEENGPIAMFFNERIALEKAFKMSL